MKILFIGDVMGKPGRRIVQSELPRLVDRRRPDYVVVNVENAAGGFGITPEVLAELEGLGIDCYTSGNHIWDKKEGLPLLDEEPRLLRPANYPEGAPGHGVYVGQTASGIPVATLNLEGRVFMNPLDSPFQVADRLLAEATSEKAALAYHVDGRVSAVLGTHTHVPTADERVLPQGTALQTDVGMTGPYDSIIGMRRDKVMHRFLTQLPAGFDVAKHDVWLCGALLDIDEATGKARAIERIQIRAD